MVPPHTPSVIGWSSAQARHWPCAGQARQIRCLVDLAQHGPGRAEIVLGLLNEDARIVIEDASAQQALREQIRAGIPALSMKVGYEEKSPEAEIARKWTAERYHAPSDDLNQPIDMSAANGYVSVVQALAVRIANRSTRPSWNANSFFKRFAKKTSDQ